MNLEELTPNQLESLNNPSKSVKYGGLKIDNSDGGNPSAVTYGQPDFGLEGEIRDLSDIEPGKVVRKYNAKRDEFSSPMMIQEHPEEVEGPGAGNSSWTVEVEILEGPMEGRTQEKYLTDMGVVSYRADDEKGLVYNAQNALVEDEEATPDFVI
jgi:hypothetical protein